jgi:hypothetical protein
MLATPMRRLPAEGRCLFIGKTDMENPNGERAMPKESKRMVVVLSGFLVLGP